MIQIWIYNFKFCTSYLINNKYIFSIYFVNNLDIESMYVFIYDLFLN
jgi:hypothetical protein